jgi:hypothetical protein
MRIVYSAFVQYTCLREATYVSDSIYHGLLGFPERAEAISILDGPQIQAGLGRPVHTALTPSWTDWGDLDRQTPDGSNLLPC